MSWKGQMRSRSVEGSSSFVLCVFSSWIDVREVRDIGVDSLLPRQADIDRMVNEAKQFEQEDAEQRERVQARNQLEAYTFQVKQALNDYGSKLPVDDSARAKNAVEDTLRWLDSSTLAEKDEIESKDKELKSICQSILAKLHQSSEQPSSCGNPGSAGFNSSNYPQGPTVEEVD